MEWREERRGGRGGEGRDERWSKKKGKGKMEKRGQRRENFPLLLPPLPTHTCVG